MRSKADQLLEGATDLHCHGYPEFSADFQARLDDQETLELAQRAGMRALVFKSHMWPTVGRVDYLRRLVPGFQVFGSISLNISSGGLSPWAVESAALQGAKVIWMPTWSSASAMKKPGVIDLMKKYVPSLEAVGPMEGLTILDESRQVLSKVKQILSIAKKYALVISTGHLSPEESLKLAQEAENVGFSKLIFGHPLGTVAATMAEIQQMAQRNCFIELCALNAFFVGNTFEQTVKVIRSVGAGSCVLTSDSFRSWRPPPSELLRMFIGALLESDVEEDEIRQMVQTNPAKLLDILS